MASGCTVEVRNNRGRTSDGNQIKSGVRQEDIKYHNQCK